MSQYRIEKDVYFAYVGQQVVFLDLKQNKYVGVDWEQAATLDGVVAGWKAPAPRVDTVSKTMAEDSLRKPVTDDLVRRGLLTESLENGKIAAPTQANKPTSRLLSEYESRVPQIGLKDIVRFARAYFSAVAILRVMSLARIAHRLERRKQNVGDTAKSRDIAALRDRVLVYTYIRPFFLQHRTSACWIHSYSLSFWDITTSTRLGCSVYPLILFVRIRGWRLMGSC